MGLNDMRLDTFSKVFWIKVSWPHFLLFLSMLLQPIHSSQTQCSLSWVSKALNVVGHLLSPRRLPDFCGHQGHILGCAHFFTLCYGFHALSVCGPALACLTSVHWVFTKVLALLHPHGIPFVGYLDNLLSKQLQQTLSDNVALTFQALQPFSWIINLQKSVLASNHHMGASVTSPRHSLGQNIFLSV